MTNEVQMTMDAFRRIVQALRKASKGTESDVGLRAAQFFVLQQLKKFEPLSVNDLAQHTYSHQSTVSVVVDGLVKLGYVNKAVAKEDRRRIQLTVTEKGHSLIKDRQQTIQEKFVESLMKMKKKDRLQLAKLLEEFICHADLATEAPNFFFECEDVKKRKKSKIKKS